MAAQFEPQGIVGTQSNSDGNTKTVRISRGGQQIANLGHGKYYELVRDGVVYLAQTAVTGVAPGTAIGTTAAAALYNPAGSGKLVVLLHTGMGYVSGTLGAGVISYCVNTNLVAAAVTGTAMAHRNALVGAAAAASASALTTATLPAAPTPIRNFGSMGPMLATSVVQPWILQDEVDGAIILKPGATVSLQATAGAGTSPLVTFGFMWAEMPE